MRRLIMPVHSVGEVANLCAQSIQDDVLRNRLIASVGDLQLAEATYCQNGIQGTLYTIPKSAVAGQLSSVDIARIYTGTFVRSARTRRIYESIRSQPTNDVCPTCGQRTVASLDHYLAKSHHSLTAITPANLAPACLECNKVKEASQPTTAAEQPLHPYFDNVEGGRWLFAKVIETVPAAIEYFVQCPQEWDGVLKSRVGYHFEAFELGKLYASHAGEEISNIRFGLEQLLVKGGADKVREHLDFQEVSFAAAQLNSWQRAMYDAAKNSIWFCSGGFR